MTFILVFVGVLFLLWLCWIFTVWVENQPSPEVYYLMGICVVIALGVAAVISSGLSQ